MQNTKFGQVFSSCTTKISLVWQYFKFNGGQECKTQSLVKFFPLSNMELKVDSCTILCFTLYSHLLLPK